MTFRAVRRAASGCIAAALLLVSAGCASTPGGGAETLSQPVPTEAQFTPAKGAVPAPDFTATLVDGTEVTLSELREDRVVVLQFTATWCAQCQDAEPRLSELTKDFNGAVLPVHVALEEPLADVRNYLSAYKVMGPALVDTGGRIWRDYAVTEPPLTAVVDTAGGIVRMWPGGASKDELRSTLDEVVQK